MNKIRNHIGLIVSLVVFLALLGVSLFFFWQSFSRMRESKGRMEASQTSYSSLIRKKPYPNQENVEKVGENLQQISNLFSNEVDPKIRAFTIPIKPGVNRQLFLGEINQRISDLRSKARQKNVLLPEVFDLGFSQYVAGMRPDDDAYMPHLLRQLEVGSYLVETAIESDFFQIVQTNRLQFELPAGGAGMEGGGSRTMTGQLGADDPLNNPIGTVDPNPDGNYLEYPFRLTFITQTSGLRMFMNTLVMRDCPYFLVVNELTVRNLRGIDEVAQFNIAEQDGQSRTLPGAPGMPGTMGPGATRGGANPYYPMGRSGTTGRPGMGASTYPGMNAPAYGTGEQLPSSGNEYLEVTLMVTAYDFQAAAGEEELADVTQP